MNVVAIGGVPAVGKSTLVKRLLSLFVGYTPFEYGRLKGRLYDAERLFVLGEYDADSFGGTDRLAMDVQPDAEAFIAEAANSEEFHRATVLFEGDRLFNGSFLETLAKTAGVRTDAYILTADESKLAARHEQRGDGQSESWLRGKRTEIESLQERYADASPKGFTLHVEPHNTPDDTDRLVSALAARHFE